MTNTTTLPARSEVPLEQTWDLASIFPTPQDWEAACAQLEGMLPTLSAYQGLLDDRPGILLEFIRIFQDAGTLMGKINVYASNAYAVDTLNQDSAARNGQARSLMAKFGAATAFFDPELVGIGFPNLRQCNMSMGGVRSNPNLYNSWKASAGPPRQPQSGLYCPC